MTVGVDSNRVELAHFLAGQRIELVDGLDLIAEERDAPGAILVVRRENLDRIAAHPERAALEIAVVAAVLQFDQLAQQAGRINCEPDVTVTTIFE